MRKPVFTPEAWEEFSEWARVDLKIVRKIIELLDDATETPFSGIGKPEPLKYNLRGCCRAAGAVETDNAGTPISL